jgi:L-ascorbate metabolism protein UlaG (beta-lactamase superfamily)
MFAVTFLGHQGWLFSTGNTNVLLDPLLCEGFGHDPRGNGFDVFPPRRIDFARCPPIDAVLFSHEHEDHFNVPSIERLDRRIPIHLSARSSTAARTILAELGFAVELLRPGKPFAVGDLAILPLPQTSLTGSHPGEWDSLALYLRDRAGDGSFFTTVDHRPQRATFERLRRRRLHPALLSYADNESDLSALFPWAAQSGDGDQSLADELRELLEGAIPDDLCPETIVLCANGLAPRGDLAWMNAGMFHRDPRRAVARLREHYGERFVAPLPGDTMVLLGGRRVGGMRPAPWIEPCPESDWPRRGSGETPPAPFAPATGRLRLDAAERARLASALADFARYLYGSSLFMETYLLDAKATGDRRPTMGLELLEGDDVESAHAHGGAVRAWDPNGCAFREEALTRPQEKLAVGIRCWASDLLAVLEVEMPAASLTLGRMSGWNSVRGQFRFDLPNLLHTYCHPLRFPERFLQLYRALRTGRTPDVRPG